MFPTNLSDLALFIGAIAALIVAHEFGHFIVARLLNVEVEEFGLGFPPRAATLFEFRGTKYTLNWLPLGGFVRPKGENDPTIPGGLAAASPGVRLAVFFAGPLANLLVAAVLFAILFARVGAPDPTRIQIVDISPNSPAATAGLQTGDFILQINDTPIQSSKALQDAIAANLGLETRILLLRGAQENTITLVPRVDPPPGEGAIGIFFGNPRVPAPLTQSLVMGTQAVYENGMALLKLPASLIQGSLQPQDARLIGYKGMYDLYQTVKGADTEVGLPTGTGILSFFASISVSLGLLNLLPIPALDGGRIMFVLSEIVLRRRVPPEFENMVNFVSISMLILLMIYINIQDFINPAQFR